MRPLTGQRTTPAIADESSIQVTPRLKPRHSAQAIFDARKPPSIHEMYPSVVYLDGKWVDISCHLCGANATSATKKWSNGTGGLHKHASSAHKDRDIVQKYDHVVAACNKRTVSPGDVTSMRKGEAPVDVAVVMNFGNVGAKEPKQKEEKGYVPVPINPDSGRPFGSTTEYEVYKNIEAHASAAASPDKQPAFGMQSENLSTQASALVQPKRRRISSEDAFDLGFRDQIGINAQRPYSLGQKRTCNEGRRTYGNTDQHDNEHQ